ncbi:potassium channels protein 7, TWiK family [Trichinella spiralis]|uniref:TWiK family of potassium channels protein 7 n=1 Tax=Trichinella spiralis TaxID=6334 RepID=E5SDA7_TRISP|nr:potassium channels protein 7, TWiK family [Trichinella spiralis]KRY39052.1 TWiK family of potassium channels protein 7 [Trichinella spiralis]
MSLHQWLENIWSSKAKVILSHVGLILIFCTYVLAGSFIFYHLEQDNEIKIREKSFADVLETRDRLFDAVWHGGLENPPSPQQLANLVDNLTNALLDAFDTRFVSAQHFSNSTKPDDVWTYSSSVFFTVTFLTTIGKYCIFLQIYTTQSKQKNNIKSRLNVVIKGKEVQGFGNPSPSTFRGRLFCVFYGLIGIPLALITIADSGKFLGEFMVHVYSACRGSILKRRRGKEQEQSAAVEQSTVGCVDVDDDERRHLLISELDKVGLREFADVPAGLVFGVFLSYTALGSLLLHYVERWDIVDAFYFTFVTMTTVGFGDLIPEQRSCYLLILLYILVGLALTTTLIDLVGVKYIIKVHYFGRAIQDASWTMVRIGGKLIRLDELVKSSSAIWQRRFGSVFKPEQGKKPTPGAFCPQDINRIRYIDFPMRTASKPFNCITDDMQRHWQITNL